jgi:hypothetical protein
MEQRPSERRIGERKPVVGLRCRWDLDGAGQKKRFLRRPAEQTAEHDHRGIHHVDQPGDADAQPPRLHRERLERRRDTRIGVGQECVDRVATAVG